ncbi:MAG: GNAT family N-acetyltransferase [Carboxylicivirga sp.]|jgi:ribosomal protein S18 acetylase RimI-like enzyme|nr:GNAT family N-acetyltransferase [Carboxylicivirga sp.]
MENDNLVEIRSLKGLQDALLFKAFEAAFKDYEIQLNQKELFEMLNRRGFSADLSFGAFVNDKLVAFTFNGIGQHRGRYTAYDTGTGTIEQYRGQGLASRIFEYSIPYLRKAGVKQYLLEVLQHNESAISVYTKLGFTIQREFNYFVKSQKAIQLIPKTLNAAYTIRSLTFNEFKHKPEFGDFNPSWQNNQEAIERRKETFLFFGAFFEGALVGYCVLEPGSGDITQIAVDKLHRRMGLGTSLLKEAIAHNQHSELKCVNTQLECSSLTRFLAAQNIDLSGKQFEMIRDL